MKLNSIILRYNAEHDRHTDGVVVSWAERALADAVIELMNQVRELEKKSKIMRQDIEDLKARIDVQIILDQSQSEKALQRIGE